MVTAAAGFHVANGFVMGLGRFVTSFISMHPAVAYTSTPKDHPAVAGRDDRMVRVVAAGLALSVTAAGVLAAQRRMRVREGWPTSHRLTTSAGNELQYEIMSHGDEDKPFLVFCAGLGTTSEQWAWISETIARQTGYGVITYARAGYAGSDYRSTDAYRLDESVEDLVDLVEGAVPHDRKVLLVGHSLGGELCRRAALSLGGRTHGVVYVDSAHPMELNRSDQQSKSAEMLPDSIRLMIWSLRLGMGTLVNRPDWIGDLPQNYQPRAFDQYADARSWTAARREWEAVEEDFRAFDRDLEHIDAHALVISAQQTTDRDPEQLLMHHELGKAHEGGDNRVETLFVEDADHGGLLTSSRHGLRVASTHHRFSRHHDRAGCRGLRPGGCEGEEAVSTDHLAKKLLTGPGSATRIAGTVMLAATIAGQHPSKIFNRLQLKDTMSVLPNWRFFAPTPAMHDYHLLYRTLSQEGETSRWKSVEVITGRKLTQIFWFPTRRPEKALFDVCSDILYFIDKGFPVVTRTPGYRVMLAYLRRRMREDGVDDAKGFQFTLVRAAGYDTGEKPETIFVSPLTPMKPSKGAKTPGRSSSQKEPA